MPFIRSRPSVRPSVLDLTTVNHYKSFYASPRVNPWVCLDISNYSLHCHHESCTTLVDTFIVNHSPSKLMILQPKDTSTLVGPNAPLSAVSTLSATIILLLFIWAIISYATSLASFSMALGTAFIYSGSMSAAIPTKSPSPHSLATAFFFDAWGDL